MDGLNRILSTMHPANCDIAPFFRLGLDPWLLGKTDHNTTGMMQGKMRLPTR